MVVYPVILTGTFKLVRSFAEKTSKAENTINARRIVDPAFSLYPQAFLPA